MSEQATLVAYTDRRKYNEFAADIARRLKCVDIDENSTIWHYTSGTGLLGIMKSQSLFSTQVSCLNESGEVRYAAGIFLEALTEKLKLKQVPLLLFSEKP